MAKVVDFDWVLEVDTTAHYIADLWQKWDDARDEWKTLRRELRNYVFATDTKHTTNSKLPWKNSTTFPKLCQLRDNLHANYMSALFPHEDWLQWEGGDEAAVDTNKRKVIEAYMKAKLRETNFQEVVSDLVYDYIDGNTISDIVWVEDTKRLEDTDEVIVNYVGPKLCRVSVFDHVFDPTAKDYTEAPKITRYLKSIGQLMADSQNHPELAYSKDVLKEFYHNRLRFQNIGVEDTPKDEAFQVDGFGSLFEYFNSDLVEILEFEGTYYDQATETLYEDRIVTVIDRAFVIRNIQNPSILGESTKEHVGWRKRPDNVWAMGPLDNLVGMQYRVDHIENAKADAIDQYIHPAKKVRGTVEDFSDMPGERINVGDDGDVEYMRPPLDQILSYNGEMQFYMNTMEEMAGAPKQAMGIRTPGEKTAYEVQQLENASGRIFQNKINQFEVYLEKQINKMFEMAKRNLNTTDVIKVLDDELAVVEFINITKDEIAYKGKFKPIGARHFAQQAKVLQELTTLMGSPVVQDPATIVHFSGINTARMVERLLNIEKYNLVRPNVRIMEQASTQRLINSAQDTVERDAITPVEEPVE